MALEIPLVQKWTC